MPKRAPQNPGSAVPVRVEVVPRPGSRVRVGAVRGIWTPQSSTHAPSTLSGRSACDPCRAFICHRQVSRKLTSATPWRNLPMAFHARLWRRIADENERSLT